ncbi:hypothetical protein PENSPDRAFT_684841 [Peniophora sp. CONT]|nr:hypothetical protein PENSPDRAFT_684841 [Peniophora sp. CONT]
MQSQAVRKGWLPVELWAKIVDDYAPPLSGLMDVVPDETDDSFDPYVFSGVSCADLEGCLSIRPALAGVNRQLRTLLHGYAPPRGCLLVTNNNAERVRRRMEDTHSSGGHTSISHVALVVNMMPGWSVTLENMTAILHLARDVDILSFGTTTSPELEFYSSKNAPHILQFTQAIQSISSNLLRIAFLDGASLLCGIRANELRSILNRCTQLRSISFHRQCLSVAFEDQIKRFNSGLHFNRALVEHTLVHVAIDSPHVKCFDRTQISDTLRLHYVRDGDPVYSYGLAHNRDSTDSPFTHLSLVMSTRPQGIDKDFATFAKHAPQLHHLRLSAPLSQLTASVPFIPPTVRTLVLVVDNSVSWNPRLPPPETLPWERLYNLLLAMRHLSGPQRRSALRRVQFMQPALARRFENEIAHRDEVKREIVAMRLDILKETGVPLKI